MKNRIFWPLHRAMNHIHKHRAKYTAAGGILLTVYALKVLAYQWEQFAIENGLDPQDFYDHEIYK